MLVKVRKTIRAFRMLDPGERVLVGVSGGAASVAFASGMAAISSVLMSLLKPGDEVVAHRMLYGSAWNFIKNILPRYGVASRLVDLTSIVDLADQITARTKVVYLETPVNPSLENGIALFSSGRWLFTTRSRHSRYTVRAPA